MRKPIRWAVLVCWVFAWVFVSECAAESTGARDLSRYHDSFDKFREDLWEKTGFIPGQGIREDNFKLADVAIDGGMARVKTATGCFSLGGLGSKFVIRGDFDVQVDCSVSFVTGVRDTDQVVMFSVLDKTKELLDRELGVASIVLVKIAMRKGRIFSGYMEGGNWSRGSWEEAEGFHGTLRITRAGKEVTALCRKEGEQEWKKLNAFTWSANDVIVNFKAQNYSAKRTSQKASVPVVATFDNFKVNAAREIIEPEI